MSAISKPSVIGGDLISAFSHSSQRPPVPGEEDDRHSTDIVVGKKLAAGYLVNGVSQILPSSIVSERCAGSQLNVRTPLLQRHSILDIGRERLSTKLDCRSDSPPLGFEPEGSACASPRFKENSSSASSTGGGGASYLRWAESLKLLLQDSEGVRLFKQFLEQEQGCSAALDFWFACTGLKMVADDQERVAGLAKMIYKRYVKGDRLRLTADARRRVVDRLRQHQIDPAMFDEAQAEVEFAMRSDDYPLFLKSDTYLQYVQSGSDSPLTANTCGTNSNSALPEVSAANDCVIRPLPTVAEDEELAIDDIRHATVASSLSLTPSALFATRRSREAVTSSSYVGISFPKCSHVKLPNPYHISYAPVSAQDSELQSLSSDALTDDTMSYTDSSVDGRERAVFTSKRKQLKAIRRNADANQQTDLNQPLIPRTERVPPDSNLAENDPKKFALLLTDKLQRVKEEQDKLERMTMSLRNIDALDTNYVMDTSIRSTAAPNAGALNNSVDSLTYTSMLLRSVLTERDGDDNAQNILEEHVSRVWESSNGPTPGGMHSPGFRTPNHHHATGRTISSSTGFSLKGASGITPKSSLHRVREDVIPQSSFHEDRLSHMVASQLPTVRHSHRHQPMSGVPTALCKDTSRDMRQSRAHASLSSRGADVVGNSAAADMDTKRQPARRSLEPVHSGVAITNVSRPACQDVAASHVPEIANERVMMWMLENEKYSAVKTRCSTDGSDRGSSHKRSSHKSTGSGGARKSSQPQPQQQASHPQHRSNRSESLDRSRVTSLSSGAANDVLTNHQRAVAQDSYTMPLNAEDSKRHQVGGVDSKAAAVLKSRSFASNNPALPLTSPRDGHSIQPPLSSVIPLSAAVPNVSLTTQPFSSSCEDLSLCGVKSDNRKSVKKPSSSEQTELTVVGYYFCDEPIPYRTTIPGRNVTLGQFKQHIAKKGNYRYFFKTVCDEFESGVVNEEVTLDNDVLPLWEGKVVGKVERL